MKQKKDFLGYPLTFGFLIFSIVLSCVRLG